MDNWLKALLAGGAAVTAPMWLPAVAGAAGVAGATGAAGAGAAGGGLLGASAGGLGAGAAGLGSGASGALAPGFFASEAAAPSIAAASTPAETGLFGQAAAYAKQAQPLMQAASIGKLLAGTPQKPQVSPLMPQGGQGAQGLQSVFQQNQQQYMTPVQQAEAARMQRRNQW